MKEETTINDACQYAQEEMQEFIARCTANGYNSVSTFYYDLSLAEACVGADKEAVVKTYRRLKEAWIGNYKFFTELVLCLNWKLWSWHEAGFRGFSKHYDGLYRDAVNAFYSTYEGNEEACAYYFRVTD